LRNLFERNHASSFGVELRALCSRIGVLLGVAVCLTFFSLAVDSGAPHTPCRIQPATGVFFAGRLNAHVFDPNGVESNVIELQYVDPLQAVELNRTISVLPGAGRVSIHLNDQPGLDRGSSGEAKIAEAREDS
jgi:hypothetical protein